MGINPGVNCIRELQRMDKVRIDKAQHAAEMATKESRREKRKRSLENDQEDDTQYGAGCF